MDDEYDSFNDDDFDGESDFDEGSVDSIDDAEDDHIADHVVNPFECVDSMEIRGEVDKIAESLAQTLHIEPPIASLLLRANGWNKEKLLDKYFTSSDEVYDAAGIIVLPKDENSSNMDPIECGICCDDVPLSETFSLECGHRFCQTCWSDYLGDRLDTAAQDAVRSVCPEYECGTAVPDSVAKKFLSESRWAKYESFLIQSFVNGHRSMRWCPEPGCIYVIRSTQPDICTVECKLGHKFCFRCYDDFHDPVDCKTLQIWSDKCRNDSETAHWIMANTKRCPICKVRIEKNHGCNHMKCFSCKHEFCWVCVGDWKEHGNLTGGFYKCNKYRPKKETEEEKSNKNKSASDKAKADLDRYLFYYQRYHSHDQSRRFAKRQRGVVARRMQELRMADGDTSWIDVQFLETANKQIMECRQILKHTYVFGYYLNQDGSEKELFEFLQQELEKNTETLHELSEQDLKEIDREKVVNYTRITKQFAERLLDGIARGLTSDVPIS
eukprot:823689_1